jgi:predicted transposase/invertase (TIGR01784 family)
MTVDDQRVDLEIQVSNEGDYPERSLYYWAREYSSTLGEGGEYSDLPRAIVVSILAFKLFDCAEFHSEFRPLEVTRHTLLTDRMALHYFELPKLPETVSPDDELKLWLSLFKAETEEELSKLNEMGVSVIQEAISAYRKVTATDEFKELERMRHYAALSKATALGNARREGRTEGRVEGRAEGYREAEEKWQGVVANKDAALANKDAALATKDATLAEQAALIEKLRARLGDK